MHIQDFINRFTNHPVLFIGTGMSLRYLETSYTWDGLLFKISQEIYGREETYYDIKSRYSLGNGQFDYQGIAEELEIDFNEFCAKDNTGYFKQANQIFYENMRKDKPLSRFKIYISLLLEKYTVKDGMQNEITELIKVRKNIGSVITTNYDTFIEKIFEFNPLIGNNILLSNPYGSVYKIHGCVNETDNIIITRRDYEEFDKKYELIRAQLLSLFIHNPIIFMGYGIGDTNIKKILSTIFTYINPNTNEADRIRKNFLLVEYQEGSTNLNVTDHDIDMEGYSTIRINKLKTDDFIGLYKPLSNLNLPVSAMDIRKVQNIVKDIYSGGNIEVRFTENVDSLNNDEKVLVIGSQNSVRYDYKNIAEIISNYFEYIEEENHQVLSLIDKQHVQQSQFFPIYGFHIVQPNLETADRLKTIQLNKIKSVMDIKGEMGEKHETIIEILNDQDISRSNKDDEIFTGVIKGNIHLEDIEEYLKTYDEERKVNTGYRKLLVAYDFKAYAPPATQWT